MVTGVHPHDFIRADPLVGVAALNGEQLIPLGRQLDAAENLRTRNILATSVHVALAVVDVKHALTDRLTVVPAVIPTMLLLRCCRHSLPLPEWACEFTFPRTGFV